MPRCERRNIPDLVSTMEQVREAVHECDWNECAAIGLNLRGFIQPAEDLGFSVLSPVDLLRFLQEET